MIEILALMGCNNLQGTVFSPVAFEPDNFLGTAAEQPIATGHGRFGFLSVTLRALLSGSLKPLLRPMDVMSLFNAHTL